MPLITAYKLENDIIYQLVWLFLLLFPILTLFRQNLLFIVCAQTPNSPMLTVAVSCSWILTTSHFCWTAAHLPSLPSPQLKHSLAATSDLWLLLWPIKCYFMDKWLSRSWMTLQSSGPRSKEGFSIHQHNQWVRNAPGLQLLGSGAGTGEIPACASLVLAFSWLFYQALPSNRLSSYISRLLVWL